jgi:hypothetical protein
MYIIDYRDKAGKHKIFIGENRDLCNARLQRINEECTDVSYVYHATDGGLIKPCPHAHFDFLEASDDGVTIEAL